LILVCLPFLLEQPKPDTRPEEKSFVAKVLKMMDVPKLHPDDARTFLGGLATTNYKICAFGLLVSFFIMFFYFNQSVSQDLAPLDESLVPAVIADVEVEIRFLGYTGACPPAYGENETYADRLENVGNTHRFTAGSIVVEDVGWVGTRALDPLLIQENGTDDDYNVSLRGGDISATSGQGLSFVKIEPSWQEIYTTRSKHTVVCEPGYVPTYPSYEEKTEQANLTNSSSRRLAPKGRGGSNNGGGGPSATPRYRPRKSTKQDDIYASDGTYLGRGNTSLGAAAGDAHSSVLSVLWTCTTCNLQRVGALAIRVKGVTDKYQVSASAIEYRMNVSEVVPGEDNALYGQITPLEKTQVFRGSSATMQKVTFMPALYTADALNIFYAKAYRIKYFGTEIGSTLGRTSYIGDTATNELNFIAEFETGSYQYSTRIEPVMTFMNMLCEVGGLFGAIAGMYVGWMIFLEKHEKFLPSRIKNALSRFDHGDPYQQDELEKEDEDKAISFAEMDGMLEDLGKQQGSQHRKRFGRPGVGIEVGVRVLVVGASAPGQRKLNNTHGWAISGEGKLGHHKFGVQMEEGERVLYQIQRRYLLKAQDQDSQFKIAEVDVDQVIQTSPTPAMQLTRRLQQFGDGAAQTEEVICFDF
jgi:hypothetical protein